ncbi:hypothetical protein ONZ45_g3153 [Pleurotus djamor]|nr:hypothetical protein ONZ45_g3153 [Pleurotus djamor]
MSDLHLEGKNPNNVIGGYKAAINNPNNSEDIRDEARHNLERAQETYAENGVETGQTGSDSSQGKNMGNFVGGHKANLKNPNTSEESKQHSEQVLKEHDAIPDRRDGIDIDGAQAQHRIVKMLRTMFPPKSKFSTDQIPDLSGKVVIVTGASSGIGKETARVLLIHGAKVYIATRNAQKSAEAIRDLKAQTGKQAHFLQLDLANLKGIKKAVEEFLSGVMRPPFDQVTADGYDLQVGTNALGHFYFTKLLLPTLVATAEQTGVPSRVMNTTSSAVYEAFSFDFTTFKDGPQRRKKDVWFMYCQSKFANLVFAIELNRRYGKKGIVSAGIDPGLIKTDLQRTFGTALRTVFDMLAHDVSKGALSQLWGGTIADENAIKGQFIVPWARVSKMHRTSENPELGQKLWEWFESQVVEV